MPTWSGRPRPDLGRARLADLVFRKSLWEHGPGSVDEAPQGEWVAAARLVLAATRRARGPVARRGGEDSGPERFGTLPRLAPHAAAWWADVQDLLRRVERLPSARKPFLVWLLDVELRRYLEDAERASDEGWEVLRSAAQDLLAQAPASVLAAVHVESRVMAWLAAADERAVLEDVAADRWLAEGAFPVEVRDGVAHAVLPHTEGVVPAEVLALGEPDTPLDLSARAVSRRDDGGRRELTVLAFVRRVGAVPDSTEARFWTLSAEGTRSEVTAKRSWDPEANLAARDRFADHTSEVYTIVLEPGSTALVADVTVAGVSRRGRLEPIELPVDPPPGAWCADEVQLDSQDLVVRGRVDGPEPEESNLHLLVQGRRPGGRHHRGGRPLRDPCAPARRPVGTWRATVGRRHLPTGGEPARGADAAARGERRPRRLVLVAALVRPPGAGAPWAVRWLPRHAGCPARR